MGSKCQQQIILKIEGAHGCVSHLGKQRKKCQNKTAQLVPYIYYLKTIPDQNNN
jgi:hypothetical protein